jgi:putative acetyltransferase
VITIRAEKVAQDKEAVHRVNRLAFGTSAEANLVDLLREISNPQISLIAEKDDEIIGHIFFSPVRIEPDNPQFLIMGLAPMAVLPEYQRQGVGTELVRKGLLECKRIGCKAVVVLGHPDYYPRFDFIPASHKGLRSEYDVPEDVFMVLELEPGTLDGMGGLIKYLPVFNQV